MPRHERVSNSPLGKGIDPPGFTLLELMITAFVFAFVGLAIGSFYVYILQSYEDGEAEAVLQRNGTYAMEELVRSIREGSRCTIPWYGEYDITQKDSITIYYPPEPYDDFNSNSQWDETLGEQYQGSPCFPSECYADLNGNGRWDSELKPAISFAQQNNRLKYKVEGIMTAFQDVLDNRYEIGEGNSVYMENLSFERPDPQDPNKIRIEFDLKDDMKTPFDPEDDLSRNFRTTILMRG